MASKVMVKLPVTSFGQVNKSKSGAVSGEIVLPANSGNRASDVPRESPPKPADGATVARLEQNIRFLQEQHQLMLAGLQGEVEALKNRNRELQFQLVFVKGSIPSSPSSPEDDTKPKPYISPKATNTIPLQVEILQKELGELKLQQEEVESRNVYLSAIVDEQKKKLERYERDREKEREQRAANQSDESDLLRKLEDAEAIIRRLRRENSDLRRETCAPQGHYQQQGQNAAHQQRRESNGYQSPRGGNGHHQGRGNRGHKGNGQYNRGNWFPPLQSQSFWQGSILAFSLLLAAVFAPLSLL